MRALSTLVLAAALVALAAAEGRVAADAKSADAHKEALKAASHAAQVFKDMNLAGYSRQGFAQLKQGRLFDAQQASTTCNRAAFADATARVLQACPSLSGLVSGATKQEDFLPGFCGSECYTVIATELPVHAACLDSTTAFLVYFVTVCQTKPRCFSEGFIGGGARLTNECGAQTDSLFAFSNLTTASLTQARSACTGTCVSRTITLLQTYPECVTDDNNLPLDVPAVAGLYRLACQTYNGDICSVNLRNLGRLDCSTLSSCTASDWCNNNCDLTLTNERLNSLCSTCLTSLLPFVSALSGDAVQVASSVSLFCSRADPTSSTSAFCYPIGMAGLATVSTTSSYTNSSVATICAGDAGRCIPRVINTVAAISEQSAGATFAACVQTSTSTSRSSCVSRYETSVRAAVQMRATANILCAQNNDNNYCLPLFISVYSAYYCYWYSSSGTTCSSTCASLASSAVTAAGCCLPFINEMIRMSDSTNPASYLPSGARTQLYYTRNPSTGVNQENRYTFTHNSLYSRVSIDRPNQPLGFLGNCMTNSSELWAMVENDCPARFTPVARAVQVTLAWTRVNADPALKARITQSMRNDVAAYLGVPPSAVLNGSLSENAAQRVQLRSSTRRQTAATYGSGCSFNFVLSAANSTQLAAALDAGIAANSFVTPSTATTVKNGCAECLDARSSSLASAAAPAPGAPATGGGSASSAATFAAGVTAALAFALAMVL